MGCGCRFREEWTSLWRGIGTCFHRLCCLCHLYQSNAAVCGLGMMMSDDEMVRTAAPSAKWALITSFSAASAVALLCASREGERMLPAPPRPVEITWLGLDSARRGWGSRPRAGEKSSGPVSGLASREAEAQRMFPTPPRPVDCEEVKSEM